MASDVYKIGFIGGGRMAEALIGAILREKLSDQNNLVCSDLSAERRRLISDRFNVEVTENNQEVFRRCDIVFLAIKPQNFPQAVVDLKTMVRPDHIIVSIMAGVRIAKIQQYLPGKIIRAMPNTASLVGEMAAGWAAAENVPESDRETINIILSSAGLALSVDEEDLDAVTGLSGSGPAFIAYLIKVFIEAGVEQGLGENIARNLTLKSFAGTAKLLSEWNMEPDQLIKMVSSPKGTTVAGREILESSNVGEIIKKTIARATDRSRELG